MTWTTGHARFTVQIVVLPPKRKGQPSRRVQMAASNQMHYFGMSRINSPTNVRASLCIARLQATIEQVSIHQRSVGIVGYVWNNDLSALQPFGHVLDANHSSQRPLVLRSRRLSRLTPGFGPSLYASTTGQVRENNGRGRLKCRKIQACQPERSTVCAKRFAHGGM
jgi:hypothetical protein